MTPSPNSKTTVLVAFCGLGLSIATLLGGVSWGAGIRDERLKSMDARVAKLEEHDAVLTAKLDDINQTVTRVAQKLDDLMLVLQHRPQQQENPAH